VTSSAAETRIAVEGVPGAWCGNVWIPGRSPRERRILTDQQKQAILDWLPDHSWSEALTTFGVYSATIILWRRQLRSRPAARRTPVQPPTSPHGPGGPYGCMCGHREPTHRDLARHITQAKNGAHRLADRPNEPSRLAGQVRATVTVPRAPERVLLVHHHHDDEGWEL